MISEFAKPILLVLSNDEGLGRVTVDLESFLEFDAGIAAGIDCLVEKWIPLAAPKAARQTLPGLLQHRE